MASLPPLARAEGALTGLAVGDALGMPTQGLSPAVIRRTMGRVDRLLPAAPDHPIAAGLPAGSVTDDTEQALLLAETLLENAGRIDPAELARRLTEWEERMRARGSLDLLGPSTRAAIAAVQRGVPPAEAGRSGTTNGAAMRIAPVGIACDADDLPALVDRVAEACLVTHATSVAVAGAAAVAAAVSAGVAGAAVREAIEIAVEAARLGAAAAPWAAGADVGTRIRLAVELARDTSPADLSAQILAVVGTGLATQESVPATFAVLAAHPADPWDACTTAASLGGDTDTIAAMAGAIGGAVHGVGGFPAGAVATVRQVNDLPIERLAAGLVALR
jgi:ADP-ribosylglycohydrolase